MAKSEEVFDEVFEFSVQETLKDLSQNGKLIVLKPEEEATIRDESKDRMSLQSTYHSNTCRRLHGYRGYLHITLQICFKDMC